MPSTLASSSIGVEGLDDVVVGSGLQAGDLVGAQRLRGEHDDGRVGGLGVLAQALRHLEPVDPRHHHVEQDQIGPDLSGALQRFLAVTGDRDVIARRAQVHLDESRDVWIVVDDQIVSAMA